MKGTEPCANGCGVYVLTPGLCGFCEEEKTGEKLTQPKAPRTNDRHTHRMRTAMLSAGEVSGRGIGGRRSGYEGQYGRGSGGILPGRLTNSKKRT